jgi:hypothetical protein
VFCYGTGVDSNESIRRRVAGTFASALVPATLRCVGAATFARHSCGALPLTARQEGFAEASQYEALFVLALVNLPNESIRRRVAGI